MSKDALDKKTDLIKELREQLLLLKERNDELEAKNNVTDVPNEATGLYKDVNGIYRRVVIHYNPTTKAVKFSNEEELTSDIAVSAYRMREHLEMKILKKGGI